MPGSAPVTGAVACGWEQGVIVRLIVCVASLALIAGCRQGPSRVAAPSWNPDDFADAILEKLDKNTDSAVDMTEVAAAPGLAWGAVYIDTDKNKSLSRDELVARFEMYRNRQVGLTSKQMQLSYKGRPLSGAKVTLVPEYFLADVIEPAAGEADAAGMVSPVTQGAEVPGVRAGYYRQIRVGRLDPNWCRDFRSRRRSALLRDNPISST
jgi:hypothetical protein